MTAAIVEVRFKGNRREFFTSELDSELAVGAPVLVPAGRGQDLAFVSAVGEVAERKCGVGCDGCAVGEAQKPQGAILRSATPEEAFLSEQLRVAEEDVRRKVMERARAHNLEMKVSDAEWQWDRKKLTVYFTADKRVDFRSLVRELAGLFRTRIELRQIGARDESKRLGGVGRCGREFCCSSWLPELQPVSLSLAKDQHLSLNPTQISGGCGRLLCCLRYEHDFYVSARKRFPKLGRTLTTPRGRETVDAVEVFRDRVVLKSDDGSTRSLRLEELKREVSGTETPPTTKSTATKPATAQRAEPSLTHEQAVDAVSPRKRRRRRRRRRKPGRGPPPTAGDSPEGDTAS